MKAQEYDYTLYGEDRGFLGYNSKGLLQDKLGFLWLLSDGHILRFNGNRFDKIPGPPPSLPGSNEKIWDQRPAGDSHIIFFGTAHAFLFNYQKNEWTSFSLLNKKNEKPIPIKAGKKEYIFHYKGASSNRQLFSYDKAINGEYPIIDLLPNEKCRSYSSTTDSIFQFFSDFIRLTDKNGNLLWETPVDSSYLTFVFNWAFNGNKLSILNNDSSFKTIDFETRTVMDHPLSSRLTPELYNTIFSYSNGDYLLTGFDKFTYYNADQDTLIALNTIMDKGKFNWAAPIIDKTGIVWCGTRRGLLKLTDQLYPFRNYYIQNKENNKIYSARGFTEDQEGNVYVGLYPGEIAKIQPNGNANIINKTSVSLPFDLEMENGKILLNSGNFYNPISDQIEQIEGGSKGQNVDIGVYTRDQNGRLWWCFEGAIYRLENINGAIKWVEEQRIAEKKYLLGTDAFHHSKQHNLFWITLLGNLYCYNPKSKKLTTFPFHSLGLQGVNNIYRILEDDNGLFWLGTNNGLFYFDPQKLKVLKSYQTQHGLANNYACGLLMEGDSALWVSTFHGLSRFNLITEQFINFYEIDGLSSNEFNRMSYFKASDGRLFFGGVNGVNAFYPEAIMQSFKVRNEKAKLVLASFEHVDERKDTLIKQVHFKEEPTIDLYHWDRSFSFSYLLTDFRDFERIKYRYRMKGYETSWSTLSYSNTTRYSSLPAGDYTFQVQAIDQQGFSHPSELNVNLIVHPPWWQTNWAYLFYIMLIASIIYLVVGFWQRRLTLKTQLQYKEKEAKRLAELDQFKSQLYTNLTHEFRTPLTVILGMVDQVRKEPKKYLDEGTRLIEMNGRNLLRLINQLLDLSKLENNAFQLDLQQGDIVSYIRYLTQSFQTFANSKNLSLRFFTTLNTQLMDYDPDQIKQILSNLLSNAVKFTPSSGAIEVHLDKSEANLIITVKDTGIGIPNKDLNHIFDRFYQVDGSVTRAGEGTGIGLAHTKELVSLMGGEIEVKSQINHGSIFTISLPISNNAKKIIELEPKAIQFDYAEPNTSTKIPSQSNSSNEDLPLLLLIEDNPDVVIYLKSCLNNQYDISVAYNGKIGIEKAIEQTPDIIISDVMMPEKDGYEVCNTLKTDERTSHIPIILLTAKADNTSKLSGLKKGADAYLTKPFDKQELIIRLEKLLTRQQNTLRFFTQKYFSESNGFNDTVESEELLVEDAFIQKVRTIIEANYQEEDFSLLHLCRAIGMSRSQLFRKMKALIDVSPSDYIRTYRLQKAKALIEKGELNISEVAWAVGYKNLSNFSRAFLAEFGVSPSTFQKK